MPIGHNVRSVLADLRAGETLHTDRCREYRRSEKGRPTWPGRSNQYLNSGIALS